MEVCLRLRFSRGHWKTTQNSKPNNLLAFRNSELTDNTTVAVTLKIHNNRDFSDVRPDEQVYYLRRLGSHINRTTSKLTVSVVSTCLIFTGQDDRMKAAAASTADANDQSNDSAWDWRVERGELELCITLSDYVFLRRKQTSNWAQENIRPLIIPLKRALLYHRKWGLWGVQGFFFLF